jgi:RNA polymerase sigma-70 factor (ECF subfamily)
MRLLPKLGSRKSAPSVPQHDALAQLARQAAGGDGPALRTFLTTMTPQLLRVVRRVLGADHPDLEDVTAEAAYAVLEALPRFRGEGTVRHFACRVAALTAMNVQRRDTAKKRARQRDPGDPEMIPSEIPGPDQGALTNSLVPIVRELVTTLPDPLAEALSLHVILGYTVSEIASSSGVPVETVRSRLRLAKRSLRKRALSNPSLREVMGVES